MNRRDFIGFGGAAAVTAFSGCATVSESAAQKRLGGQEKLGPVLTDVELRTGTKVRGKCAACYIDDVIWVLRDLARMRPKSLYDVPLIRMLKECHDRYGFKVQLNLFYRTDFFYGTDEFTLADVPSDYRREFQESREWLRFGFHSLQEFPDYPWVNIDYADMKGLFQRFVREVERFAGPGCFTYAVVPHWVPVSKDGCRALKDCGVKLLMATDGDRFAYTGDRSCLPYGHGLRAENNRKPETALYRRVSNDVAIEASLCGYNHTSTEQTEKTNGTYAYVYDRSLGLGFKRFRSGPMLNLETPESLDGALRQTLKCDLFTFASHEQYFYPEYLAYQPFYGEMFLRASKFVRDHGYSFVFMEDTVD